MGYRSLTQFALFDLTTRKVQQLTKSDCQPVVAVGMGFVVVPDDYDGQIDGRMVDLSGSIVQDEAWSPPTVDPLAQIRNERNALLRDSLWTQLPDAPLTPNCIDSFRAWRVQLNRWLVDYPDGQTDLPDAPTLAYLPMADQL